MDFRPGRPPAVTTVAGTADAGMSVAVEPEIPPAVAKRIASAVQSSRSEGTRKTYAAAWRRFTGWCETNGHVTLPAHPITVAASYGGRPVNDGMVKRWHAPSCVPPLPVAGMVIDASGR
jgi:hypothetical protein